MFREEKKMEPRKQISWNLGQFQAFHIGNLLRNATNHMLNKDLFKWRNTLMAIRENINYACTPDERKQLDMIEDEMKSIKIEYEPNDLFREKYTVSTKNKLFDSLKKYHRELMNALAVQGYFPNKDDRTKLHF